MKNTDLLFAEVCKKPLTLSHQCKTENGIEEDEIFTIKPDSLKGVDFDTGSFEQATIINQYGRKIKINVNQITSYAGYKEPSW